MILESFAREVEEALQIPPGTITPDTLLSEIPKLDSMGRLVLTVMFDSRFGFVLEPEHLNNCNTFRDLYEFVVAHSKEL